MVTALRSIALFTATCLLSTAALAFNDDPEPTVPADPSPPSSGDSAFPAVIDFSADGPYRTTKSSGGDCTIYHPRTLSENGVRHPIIVWGNGTGGTPDTYRELLSHFASHGFVVAAANTEDAGSGEEMIDCLNYLTEQNARNSGTFAGTLDLTKVGAAGHSQGGGGTLMAGRDSRIKATAPFEPYVLGLGHDATSQDQQHGPMFLMGGSSDTLVNTDLNQDVVFRVTNVPVFYGILQGAGHFVPVGDGGDFRGPATAWFRYYLMSDQNAAALFLGDNCQLCIDRNWEVRKKDLD
ncbi:alpha/beta hydrolase [Ketobacter sp. MCCC 1A13808]|uniref:alpha/beta hydrolase family protein n=1 Tax=Ketobacter sp. MCCC 1A13808 TaxID=2602738 RepID=UPI000F11282A|nr:alpha/beta hydrolase [Ketobacter sp. MCCC 1A13808]MVF13145.1 alpha/beta hydrolase [Ketobacter sp. MCCC 1A13808]RLP54791.1 MAG: alpha/beta hydrolase [Ketobacter sp.]